MFHSHNCIIYTVFHVIPTSIIYLSLPGPPPPHPVIQFSRFYAHVLYIQVSQVSPHVVLTPVLYIQFSRFYPQVSHVSPTCIIVFLFYSLLYIYFSRFYPPILYIRALGPSQCNNENVKRQQKRFDTTVFLGKPVVSNRFCC